MSYFIEGWKLEGKPGTRWIFLAEGESEVGFIETYLSKIGISKEECAVFCFRGVSKLRGKSDTIYKFLQATPEILKNVVGFGLIADSDTNPVGRIDTVIECAKAFGFEKAGKSLKSTGKYEVDGKRFAFSLSPSTVDHGNIETLVMAEVAGSAIMKCVYPSLDCLSDTCGLSLSTKASAQIYISAASNSSMAGVGRAFAAGFLDVDHVAYEAHRTMVNFVLDAAP